MLFSMSGCMMVVDGVPQDEYDALKNQYDAMTGRYNYLKEEYDALVQSEQADDVDITIIRGIAYELLFDLLFHQVVLEESYDLKPSVDKMVEQYELDEQQKTELHMMMNAIIDRYFFPEKNSTDKTSN